FGLSAAPAPAPQPGEAGVGALPPVDQLSDPAPLLPMLEDAGEAYFCGQWQEGAPVCLAFSHKAELSHADRDLAFLRAFCQTERIRKSTHDGKAFHRLALSLGEALRGMKFDTILAAYLLNPSASSYEGERVCAEYGVPCPALEDPSLQM